MRCTVRNFIQIRENEMRRCFVIEADTDNYSAFVYEVQRTNDTNDYIYRREMGGNALFNELPGPKLYGKLHPLLVTKDTILKAKPIEPELAEVKG